MPVLLLAFALVATILFAFPGIDLAVSRAFFDGRIFPAADHGWAGFLHGALGPTIEVTLGGIAVLAIYNRLARRTVLGVTGRTVVYLVVVLAVGSGLIVNTVLKDHVGRARPRDVVQFGGDERFTPAFVISDACDRNCSFSSGEAAGGFFALAVARALGRRRSAMILAAAFGAVISLARIASGAHFLSDVIVSLFVMLIVSDLAAILLRDRGARHAPTS